VVTQALEALVARAPGAAGGLLLAGGARALAAVLEDDFAQGQLREGAARVLAALVAAHAGAGAAARRARGCAGQGACTLLRYHCCVARAAQIAHHRAHGLLWEPAEHRALTVPRCGASAAVGCLGSVLCGRPGGSTVRSAASSQGGASVDWACEAGTR